MHNYFLFIKTKIQAVASKLHGVEVEIKIIKHKGDPITTTEDNSQQVENSNHKTENNHNNTQNSQVLPPTNSLCEY